MSERREEAYSASNTIKIRFYETCGHNEPKVSVKLIMSLQRRCYLRKDEAYINKGVSCVFRKAVFRLPKGRLSPSERPSFSVQKTVFHAAKDGLSQKPLPQGVLALNAPCRACGQGLRRSAPALKMAFYVILISF